MSSNSTYRPFAKFYDAYVAGFDQDLPFYDFFCTPENRILEIGCGTGRVLQYLAGNGCTATGVDISDEMLQIAAQKLANEITNSIVKLMNFNFENGSLPDSFDRVLITFYTINYLLGEIEMNHFLSNIYQSMDKGGIILLDLFYPRPLSKPESAGKIFESSFRVDGVLVPCEDCRKMDGDCEIREQKYDFEGQIIEITTRRRFYSKQQISGLLEAAGFVNIEVTDGYNLVKFHQIQEQESTNTNFIIKATK
jgi:SAM-dependent methyltransferase